MEGQELNEEEEAVLDYKTPKGQLIQLVEKKLKKPEIDDSLGKILDKFQELTNEQTSYLEVGIFHMNFTEDALLIQCCGQLYGKRVDKLWEELLQFHTRMVKYDQKNANNSADVEKIKSKQEIAKLEERLNRGKRKKIVLAQAELENQTDPATSGGRVYFITEQSAVFQSFTPNKCKFPLANDVQDDEPDSFEYERYEEWEDYKSEHKKQLELNYNSQLVMEYNKIGCSFKQSQSPFFNELVYDFTEPEVYNTKEGRLISHQLVRQMFEDNDNCLIPDENFVIARLRIAYSIKSKWMIRNKIDTSNPKSYKEAWQKFRRQFYAEERRKIQNMPQKSREDVVKFFEALKEKERIAREKVHKLEEMGVKNLPAITFHSVIVEPLREDYDGIFDPYIPEGYEVSGAPAIDDIDDEFERNWDSDPQAALLEQLNRTDDSGVIADHNVTDHEEPNQSIAAGTDTPFEEDGEEDGSENRDETSSTRPEGATSPNTERATPFAEDENDITDPNELDANLEPDASNSFDDIKLFIGSMENNVNIISDSQREKMNNALKEFVQHNESLYKTLENSYFEETDGIISICYYKSVIQQTDKIQKNISKKKDKNNNAEQESTMKRILDNSSKKDESVPKRRKLSKKQVEKLQKSLIVPVKELKWNSFFSHNYQPEAEEGVIAPIDYESDTEDEEMFDNINEKTIDDLPSHIEPENNNNHSDQKQLTQDSGIDISMNETQESQLVEKSAMQNDTAEILEVPQNDETPASAETINNNISDINKNNNVLDDEENDPLAQLGAKERERHEMRLRVEEWRKYITPKLKSLEEQEFDIHKYSADIIDSVEINETKSFADIISGKCSTEVVRYFISSLQLANTLNVEICGVTQGELANDTFQLKLLNKEQYHEHLQEYQAPSEENFREKLKKIREIQKQNEFQVVTQKKPPLKRKIQKEDREFLPKENFKPQSQKTRVNPKKRCRILNEGNTERSLNNSQASILEISQKRGSHFQQPSTSRQANLADQPQKNKQLVHKVQKKNQEHQPEEDCMPQRQKLTIKPKSSRVNFNDNIQILNYDIRSPPSQQDSFLFMDTDCQTTKSSSGLCQNQELYFDQPSTSWQADLADQQVQTRQDQPEENLLAQKQKLTIKKKSPNVSSKQKVRILNYEIKTPTQNSLGTFSNDSHTSATTSSNSQRLGFQQHSTLWQADLADQQEESMVDSAISDMDRTPARSSCDSGFNTSCDDDLLEQFDQLQQISGPRITSTPLPCKVLKIKLARNEFPRFKN
ncbi:unnamed protein product [Ceutorhynchus assimilis]|uniref:Condensin-2 complex subunit H2 C-terminal domain-containing protein n=1 Tax=Ceutorhynchus assimilis TaxID=467358 RepID=A0A9P0DEB9_9CUCU|nr:unnamed protein product [Ceutorhynchus assimilis]